MTEPDHYADVRTAVREARAALVEDHCDWTPANRAGWTRALDSIEAYLSGEEAAGFSIIRSLDAMCDIETPTAQAILRVATALRRAGVDRYS